MITAAKNGVVIVWDVETGKEVARHEFGSYTWDCLLLNDDHALVASRELFDWDIAAGRIEKKGQTSGCEAVAVSADGSTLATSGWGHDLQTWDMDSRQPIRRFSGHTQRVTSIAFLPN